jgi:hypothetical protein
MPRDDLARIPADRRPLYDRAAREYASPRDRMRLLAYLEDADWDEDIAHEKMEDLQELVAGAPPPSIERVRAFYEADPEGARAPPVAVLLENERGECARAVDGTPIVAAFGTLRGDTQELIDQLGYVFSRVDRHTADTEAPRVTFVTDLAARAGKHHLRGPDTAVADFLMKFPLAFKSYTCGVEPWMDSVLGKARQWAPSHVVDKYQVSTGFDILDGVVTPANRLPWWGDGGGFELDLPRLVAHLAREERAGA